MSRKPRQAEKWTPGTPVLNPALTDLNLAANVNDAKEVEWIEGIHRQFVRHGAHAGTMLGMALGWLYDEGVSDAFVDQAIADIRAAFARNKDLILKIEKRRKAK